MGYKIKSPYHVDNTPIYFVKEDKGVLGRANKNGTITINSEVSCPKLLKEIIKHEKVHLDQMKRGDLHYDDKYIYWKGKKYKRGKKDGSRSYPWEKEAYNKK
jgi:hypothetical protein